MAKRHECQYFFAHRGQRTCKYCGKKQWQVKRDGVVNYEPEMHLKQFADHWLPAISGTEPKDMMQIRVAFPFEWNSYESWNVVFRVRFDFSDVLSRRLHGQGTRADVMNGWMSKYQECFNRIDAEAAEYFEKVTGRPYMIGDNTYAEMRRIIQS